MRFKVETTYERRARISKWNSWFAWYPVRLTSDCSTVIWLEKIYRRSHGPGYDGGEDWVYALNSLDALKIDTK